MKKSKYVSTQEAAIRLGVTGAYLRRLIARGDLAGEKVGHTWVLTEKALAGFKRKRTPALKTN